MQQNPINPIIQISVEVNDVKNEVLLYRKLPMRFFLDILVVIIKAVINVIRNRN